MFEYSEAEAFGLKWVVPSGRIDAMSAGEIDRRLDALLAAGERINENGIPLFSVDSELIDKSFVAFGPDYYQTGYDGGTYLARVLNGENTADLPIYATEKTSFIIGFKRKKWL